MLNNAEILDFYLYNPKGNLPKKCVDYQFKKLAKTEPWKWQFKDDFYSDLILILLNYDNAKLNNAHEGHHMNALITRIIQNNIYSSSSKFYSTYLKFSRQSDDLDDLIDDEDKDE